LLQFERIDASTLNVLAPAKINLNLLVGPARSDGFHPLDSYVAKVNRCDELRLVRTDRSEVTLQVENVDCGPVEQNLAWRAATALRTWAENRGSAVPGVEMTLRKHIPAGAGLGGGSSDAASVLLGLRELWEVDISPAALAELAAELGSDVPLFLDGPTCRMQGRGEILTAVTIHPFWAVLVMPGLHCATGAVYQAYDQSPQTEWEQLPADRLAQPASRWRDALVNHLHEPALRVQPKLAGIEAEFSRHTADVPVCMTGSGSALFVLLDDEPQAERLRAALPEFLQEISTVIRSNPW
jgi:4-diphosphocytidyl-2C-methyl-D-erythritol kinase